MSNGLSVVIPNYNGVTLFPQTLPTLFTALQRITLPYEVIVVDDCSTDTSVSYLHKEYPDVTVIRNEVNSGFSITANKGILAGRYQYVFLLNSDVKLEPDYFTHQFPYFNRPGTFGVMGRIIGWEDELIQDGAKYPSFHGVKIKTSGNYLLEEEEAMQDGLYSMYLSGANALMDREKLVQCGMLNELFSPFYVEDYELSLRAWRLGWKCYYDHASVCRHRTSTSIRSKERMQYIETVYNRNKFFLHAIHLDGATRYLWYLQLVPEALARGLTLRWSYFKSIYLFLRSLNQVRKARLHLKEISGGNTLLSVKEVARFIKASIHHKKIRRF